MATVIHQCVFVNPTDAGAIGSETWFRGRGKTAGDLAEVFQDARTRPVQIRLVIEDHVDIRIPKEGIASHHTCAGHRQHCRRQRIGHLIFDNLGRLTWEFRSDDDLSVGQIGQCIQRRNECRANSPCSKQNGHHQHDDAIAD